MSKLPRKFEDQNYVHFITFSCYRRRRFLEHDRICKIVLGNLGKQLKEHEGNCHGFVLMPDHVHLLVQFQEAGRISSFLREWKHQTSFHARKTIKEFLPRLSEKLPEGDPFWQRRSYDFPIESAEKYREKLEYVHLNPVRAGLVERPIDWKWSSARWYELRQFVGVEIVTIDSLS